MNFGGQIWCILCLKLKTPYGPMLKKKKKKWQKKKKLKFHNTLNNFGRDPP